MKKVEETSTKQLDNMKKNLLQNKLMKVIPIRISEDLEAELSKLAKEIGESKQTAIRLTLREGIEVVRRKFANPQPKKGQVK